MARTFGSLKRVVFRAQTTSRVKDLRGFLKGHVVPDRANARAQKFIARLTADDIKADVDDTYQALRESFAFRRKQLESSVDDDGSGFIHTPLFDYVVHAMLDPDEPSLVIWRREVAKLTDPNIVRSPRFLAVFGTIFHTLVFDFAEPMDLTELVDHLEEQEVPGVTIRFTSDVSSCDISMKGFRGGIHITPTSLTIEGRNAPTASSLFDQFLDFLERFPRATELPALK